MNPIKINNISSSVCCVNLRTDQGLYIRTPYCIDANNKSQLLNCIKKDDNFFEIYQNNKKLKNWNFSNLHIGDIEVSYRQNFVSHICINLQIDSFFLTTINPNKLKINSNQILEIVLLSDSKKEFKYKAEGVKNLGYGIYNNDLLSDIFNIDKFQHHIWLKFSNFKNNIFFANNFNSYNCFLEVKNSKPKDFYYTKKINLIKKQDQH